MRKLTSFGRHGWAVWTAVGLAAAALSFVFLDARAIVGLRGIPDQTRRLFRPISDLGSAEWIIVLCVVAVVFFWLALRGAADLRSGAAYRLAAQSAAYVLAAVAVGGLSATLLKNVIGRARPREFDSVGPDSFAPFAFDSAHASFPSGHAATIFALAAALAFLRPGLRWIFYGIAAAIAATRVIVGAHYPADVIAGALLGMLAVHALTHALAARKWLFRHEFHNRVVLRGAALRASPRNRPAAVMQDDDNPPKKGLRSGP